MQNKKEMELYFLWKQRAVILRRMALLMGVKPDLNPIEILERAKNENFDHKIKYLLKSFMKIRSQLYQKLRERFNHYFVKAQQIYGEEGKSFLKEELLKCIDRCKIGKEEVFPAYFKRYSLQAFSKIEDERMSNGYSIPREKKLLYRKIKKLLPDDTFNDKNLAELSRLTGQDPAILEDVIKMYIYKTDYNDNFPFSEESDPETIVAMQEEMKLLLQRIKKMEKEKRKTFWWELNF